MLAVVVLGLLVGAAALTFRGSIGRAQFAQAVEQVRYLDASTRDFARRSGRDARLVFDLSDGVIGRRVGRSDELVFRAGVGAPVRVEEVRTAAGRRDYGEVVVGVSALGLSESYAVKLAGPEREQWILVAGLGGQVRTLTNEREIEDILGSATPAARRHAD